MSQIQTAGEQKYYDFISDKAKRVRTGMIVWASLLSLALISLFNNIVIALALAFAGIVLAIFNVKSQKELNGKLDCVPDKEDFFRQLAAPGVLTTKDGRILVSKDYVLTCKTDVSVYYIPDMKKMETKMPGGAKKILYLIDSQGTRHEIMSCTKKEKNLKEFDAVCHALHERLQQTQSG